MTSRGPKIKKSNDSPRESSPTSLSNTSDSSSDDVPKLRGGRGSPRSDDNSDDGRSSANNSNGKRKIDDSHVMNSANDRSKKTQKTVTFSQESDVTSTSKKKTTKSTNAKVTSARIATRSTRGSGEVELLPELPVKKKASKGKRVAKDANVTVVKMLTGTLYLYRGDRPRAEFVRYK